MYLYIYDNKTLKAATKIAVFYKMTYIFFLNFLNYFDEIH